jgi:biopolymer transport protein TolR
MKLTPRQRTIIRKRTKHHVLDPSEEDGELNIVPFLDIVVNLIIFLLATTAQVLAVAQLDAQLPTLGRSSRSSSPIEEGSTLNLSVTIAEAGVIVSGSGGKLGPGCEQVQSGRVITVPKRGNAYDWAGLTQCAQRLKRRFPDEERVILTADPAVEYQHLIAAMDALRQNGSDELFPEVLLSAGVR